MKLRVDEITAESKVISFAEPVLEINRALGQGRIREYRLEGPIAVELSYYRAGTELFFNGDLSANTVACCARCAEDFSAQSRRNFRYVLSPKALGETRSDLQAEDLGFSCYDGEEVDLTPLIREQMLLALPTRPLCREDCRGLCSRCGANLNQDDCGCRTEAGDPRLAALHSLTLRRS